MSTSCHIRNMPKGPKGQKLPADVVGNAVHIMRIATRQIEENADDKRERRYARARKGASARAATLTPDERSEIARAAAAARWKKSLS